MLRFAALLLLPAFLFADTEGVNPLGSGADVIAAGRGIYNQSCTVCHGVDGGVGDRGPALAGGFRPQRRTDAEIYDAIVNGIPGTQMPAMGMNSDDAWRITAFIRSLRSSAADFPADGDAAHGEEIFWGKAGCGGCHQIGARGGMLGPNLSRLGARMRLSEIRDALTVAKPHAPRGYQPVTVTTKDGRTIRGVVKNQHNFSIQILGEDGELHLLVPEEIQTLDVRDKSMMPTDNEQRLSPQEFQDLLAFLSRLGSEEKP
ncbi:MAG: c-type cytochrome [Bryobacterales bacterium]|nr:c-type cytochrome [Acidobacteriota bacterium]MCB9384161.1 c-type cytochrome [Bryobacterales bacterium]